MLSDIEIAQEGQPKDIREIAKTLGIDESELDLYGKYKAKINDSIYDKIGKNKDGKLILVTAINPTPAGEGKTTTTVGLGQAMAKIGKNAIIALREPSLGPVFGIKGGAAGGGYSQVIPMEDINLHFTGDMHAITSANNLLCALIDNHIFQGNDLNIDKDRILIKRCLDMNDRSLRNIEIGLGGSKNGVPRNDGFIITVASEVMAILCLSKDIADLKTRMGNILVAYTNTGSPVFARDLKAEGAMACLLKDAIKPNLVQTLEQTPALIHGGPFANIAHGCNSIIATKLGLKLADYCITEAGFGSDLGAEKFLDIKCQMAGLSPNAIVLVATTRALKYNGGKDKNDLKKEDLDAIKRGIDNLAAHIDNLKQFSVPIVVAINRFDTDTDEEIFYISNFCKENNVEFSVSEVFSLGSKGGEDLAYKVVKLCDKESEFTPLYDLDNTTIKGKIYLTCKKVYGAAGVVYSKEAENSIKEIERLGAANFPVCIAKTQYSLSDNPKLLGKPKDFTVTVSNVSLSNGAGFVVVYTGNILTMPGLPKLPAANNIDINRSKEIKGLF